MTLEHSHEPSLGQLKIPLSCAFVSAEGSSNSAAVLNELRELSITLLTVLNSPSENFSCSQLMLESDGEKHKN